jgi:radical SAM protein with 4Fe4S-binding SPASM domain
MSSIEIMKKICATCAHRKYCHIICPYVWDKIIEAERKEE